MRSPFPALVVLARALLRRSWRVFVVLGVLGGLTGGVVLGTAQLARRTGTAYERLEQVSGAPDAVVLALGGRPQAELVVGLPEVASAWVTDTGLARVGGDAVRHLGVIAGREPRPPRWFAPVVVDGRQADPAADDELVITEDLASSAGLAVGDELPLAFLTPEEITQFDTGFGAPDGPALTMRIVGVVRGALGRGANVPEAFATPAFLRRVGPSASAFSTVFVRLRDGTDGLGAFRRSAERLAAGEGPREGAEEFGGLEIQVPSRQRPVVASTVQVLYAGLGGFAAAAGVAGLLALALALRRHFLLSAQRDADVLTVLGLTRRAVVAAWALAALPLVAVGAATAVALGAVLGAIGPPGSMADWEPDPGWHANVGLLVVGATLLGVVLLAIVVLSASRLALRRGRPTPSRLVGAIAAAGTPAPAVVGARFSLEPGRGRTALPVRPALVGASVGVLGVVGVLVYAASLDALVETPSRWGWVADAFLADVPAELRDDLVDDPRTAAVATVQEVSAEVEGRAVTAEASTPLKGSVGWTVLDGRMPSRSGEVMLGPRLSRDLGREVGDHVEVRGADGTPERFVVVGVGAGTNVNNTQFGGDISIAPADIARVGLTEPFVGAQVVFAADADADRMVEELERRVDLTTPQRPPDVDNLAQLGALPGLLAAFLFVLALSVVVHLLVTSTRRRRRELDTLRAVGFVTRQVRAAIASAGLVTVAAGLVVGMPLGVAAGRLAWRLTADAVYVGGEAETPVASLVATVAVVVLATVLVSVALARGIVRRPVAVGLRDE